jgi:hypothetical protein
MPRPLLLLINQIQCHMQHTIAGTHAFLVGSLYQSLCASSSAHTDRSVALRCECVTQVCILRAVNKSSVITCWIEWHANDMQADRAPRWKESIVSSHYIACDLLTSAQELLASTAYSSQVALSDLNPPATHEIEWERKSKGKNLACDGAPGPCYLWFNADSSLFQSEN